MAGNTFGKLFRLMTFGESHGKAMGGIIDGCPAGLKIDLPLLRRELERRKPGGRSGRSPRSEADEVEFLSGLKDGVTLGTPIAFVIQNRDGHPEDYDGLEEAYRPGHADLTYFLKYGIRDHRGGGRSSGRETVARLVGGYVAKLLLAMQNIDIVAYTLAVGPVKLSKEVRSLDRASIKRSASGCPDEATDKEMVGLIKKLENDGDTIGGIVECCITGLPGGLGEPVFDKLQADLSKGMMSIGGAKGFEYGAGFSAAGMTGTMHTDRFFSSGGELVTGENMAGGILGGISTGEDITFRVAFKPVSSPAGLDRAVSIEGVPVPQPAPGRHDTCLIPRVLPVVESMTALVLADHLLRTRSSRL